jgi:hypothetical protein
MFIFIPLQDKNWNVERGRAQRVVVVGDPKQLPPTRFFDRLDDGEAEHDEDVIERDRPLQGLWRRAGRRGP